ncbi:BBA14 family lipoprotein [Borrelia persica]|uniref:BBA14 family lipoprotein n=1 Tax=Borrelia persica TaxID=44448 RepID=UPI0004637385|nr:BBA14 family lipoprotein [Borrelia persica]
MKRSILKNYYVFLCLVFLLLSCKGVASLPKEPVLTGKTDLLSLARDESVLFQYALSLNMWLIHAKHYVETYYKQDGFPVFETLDPAFQGDAGEEGIKMRIAYYQRYIAKVKPIAIAIYRKYTQVSLKE